MSHSRATTMSASAGPEADEVFQGRCVGVVAAKMFHRRSIVISALFVGAALCGVTALNGVVNAKSVPVRGEVCVRNGATAKDGLSGRGLVCVRTKAGVLRWQFRPMSAASSTAVTTTTVPAVTTTTTSAVPLAPVVVSASASNGVEVTVAGMRPDTGVYSLQWVLKGSTFNTYQMARATSASMSVPAGWFMCNRTYTFRVFAMRADWQLAEGHQTQNVTPHSNEFDLRMPECPAPVVLTCAQGGVCVVGDTGPGGGVVFYVHSDADNLFTSTGSDCNTSCKYLEAATSDQSASETWCSDTATLLGTSTAIGVGMANTTTADATCSSGAIRIAADYTNGGKSDWHLPSLDELNQLYDRRTTVGGFGFDAYWSSSEFDANRTWRRSFSNGSMAGGGFKTGGLPVRVVRAFG